MFSKKKLVRLSVNNPIWYSPKKPWRNLPSWLHLPPHRPTSGLFLDTIHYVKTQRNISIVGCLEHSTKVHGENKFVLLFWYIAEVGHVVVAVEEAHLLSCCSTPLHRLHYFDITPSIPPKYGYLYKQRRASVFSKNVYHFAPSWNIRQIFQPCACHWVASTDVTWNIGFHCCTSSKFKG